MGHPARVDIDASPQQPTAPNEYGGRVALQRDLGPGFDVGFMRRHFRKLRRRRRAQITRVENHVADAILLDTDWTTGVCRASTMGLADRAGCSRSQLFEVLKSFEGRGVIEIREVVDPCFANCTNTIAPGWKGFRACNAMRAAAKRAGRPFTCVAHHGCTTICWRPRNVAELDEAFADREPKPLRRPKGARQGVAYRTPTRAACRTDVQEPYRTPNPGSRDPLDTARSPAPSPDSRPGARARSAHEDDAARSATPRSSAPPPPAPSSPPATPRETTPMRAEARPTPERAFDGFAHRDPSPPPKSTEGTRAESEPFAAPPAEDVDAVLAADRARDGTTLARVPATPSERGCIAAELAGGWTVEQLVAVVHGLVLLEHDHGRSVASWAGKPARMQRAIDAWREAERARQRAAAAAAARDRETARQRESERAATPAPSRATPIQVVDMATYGAQARAEQLAAAAAHANALLEELRVAWGSPREPEVRRAFEKAQGELARLNPRGTR